MQKEKKNLIKEMSMKTIIMVFLFLLSISVFAILAHEVVLENEDWFDTRAFHFFRDHASPFMIQVFGFISFFGSSYFLLPAYIIIVAWLLLLKRTKDAIGIGLIGITSTLLMHGLKLVFGRKRPDLPIFRELTNFSFPSGHALSSIIFCSALIWLCWKSGWARKWKWTISILLFLFAISIGISRIVLRYHYASDVLAGFCMGFSWVILSLWFFQKLGITASGRVSRNPDSYREPRPAKP